MEHEWGHSFPIVNQVAETKVALFARQLDGTTIELIQCPRPSNQETQEIERRLKRMKGNKKETMKEH